MNNAPPPHMRASKSAVSATSVDKRQASQRGNSMKLLLVATVAFALAGQAAAARPQLQRLTWAKAVAYWTAQGKAHGVTVVCTPWGQATGENPYQCRFGTAHRVRVYGQVTKCLLVLMPDWTPNGRIANCTPGWVKTLPVPWTVG